MVTREELKEDVRELKDELKEEMGELKTDMTKLEANMKADNLTLKKAMSTLAVGNTQRPMITGICLLLFSN